MNVGLSTLAIAGFLVGVVLFFIERRKFSAKQIVLMAALAALASLGRVPFAVIPSAQPTTFLIIIGGYVLGCSAGFMIGIFAALVSNIFLGQGPWTIIQMLAWGLCGVSAGLMGKCAPPPSRIVLTAFGFAWGYLFGWLTNLWFWCSFIYPLNVQTWLATNVASFWFDTTHAVTNVVFLWLWGKDFIQVLTRFKQKLSYTHEKIWV